MRQNIMLQFYGLRCILKCINLILEYKYVKYNSASLSASVPSGTSRARPCGVRVRLEEVIAHRGQIYSKHKGKIRDLSK